MKNIARLTKEIFDARANHHALADTMTSKQAADSGAWIVGLQKELSAAIATDADPCPGCGNPPMGIQHQTPDGFEYEVGCISCPPFEHTDSTVRRFAAKGGTLPRHAVEAWNEGPLCWRKVGH